MYAFTQTDKMALVRLGASGVMTVEALTAIGAYVDSMEDRIDDILQARGGDCCDLYILDESGVYTLSDRYGAGERDTIPYPTFLDEVAIEKAQAEQAKKQAEEKMKRRKQEEAQKREAAAFKRFQAYEKEHGEYCPAEKAEEAK